MTEFQGVTERGFGYSGFSDDRGSVLDVQESSIATERRLWIGVHGLVRSHLTEQQVREVRDLLTSWLDVDDEGSTEDSTRECSRCGDHVSILNGHDECDGCEEEGVTAAVEADRLFSRLTPARREVLVWLATHRHAWRYIPNSRYAGHWERGKFHYRVIDWLEKEGVLVFEQGSMNGRVSYGGGFALTRVGEVLAEWVDR